MANYLFTDTPGATRRRTPEIILRFPDGGIPTVTFVEEDKVILADGKAVFMPVDARRVINIDNDFMQKVFAKRNIETGEVTTGSHTGAELFANVFSSVVDVYIQTGIEHDEILNTPLNETPAASSGD